MSSLSPIEKYLGLTAGRDPFSMLGVGPDDCAQQAVLNALARRLAHLDKHPHARSLEAEEVRLALYAAAAQLFDPVVREHLLREAAVDDDVAPTEPESTELSRPAGRPEAPAPTRQATEHVLEFQDAALRLIRMSGGWNAAAAHRVAALAHAYGLEHAEVRSAFHRPRMPAPPRSSVTPPAQEDAVVLQRRTRRKGRDAKLPMILTALALAIGGVFLAGATLLKVVTAPPAEAPTGQNQTERAAPPAQALPPQNDQPIARSATNRTVTVVNGANIQRVLKDAIAQRAEDAGEAAWRTEQAIVWLGVHWPDLNKRQRTDAVRSILAFLGAGAPESAATYRILEVLSRPAAGSNHWSGDRVKSEVFGVGVLAESLSAQSRSRTLQDQMRNALRSNVGEQAIEESFRGGAHASLLHMAKFFTGDDARVLPIATTDDVWRAWRASSRAVGDGRHEARALQALERFLIAGPSPANSPAGRLAVVSLLESVAWPQGATTTPAAQRLLQWFDDERVPTDSLAFVTEWLANSSMSSSVSFAMVLPRSAGPESRRGYRDRYARAWGDDRNALDETVSDRWFAAAGDAIAQNPRGQSAVEAITLLVRTSRLNEAAALRHARRLVASQLALESASRPVALNSSESAIGLLRDAAISGGGQWALQYLSAPANTSGRLRALASLPDADMPLGVVDAEVLAEVALWATPEEVRSRAASLLLARAEQATVVHGVFGALSRAPRTEASSSLIEAISWRSLPEPRSAEWPTAARRAIVERLLEMLASQASDGALDILRDAIAESYRKRLAASGASASASTDSGLGAGSSLPGDTTNGSVLEAIDAYRQQWMIQAIPVATSLARIGSAAEIDRRRQARLRIAESSAQKFLVEQAAVVELHAIIIAGEQPNAGAAIRRVLDDLAQSFSGERTVFLQMLRAEQAQMRLWALRLGHPDPVRSGAPVSSLPERREVE